MAWDLNTQGNCCGAPVADVPYLLMDFRRRLLNPIVGAAAAQFSRAGSGIYRGIDRVITQSPANMPDWESGPNGDVRGLLIESSATNLCWPSSDTTHANFSLTGVTSSAPAANSPDGGSNACILTEDTSTGTHRAQASIAATAGVTYIFTVYVRALNRTRVALFASGAAVTAGRTATFDLTAGTLANSSGVLRGAMIEAVDALGGGWYRIGMSLAPENTGTLNLFACGDDGTGLTYTGSGTGAFRTWGWDIRVGAFFGSHIPTTNAPAASASEFCSLSSVVAGFTSGSGTILVEAFAPRATASTDLTLLAIDDGTASNRHILRVNNSGLLRYAVGRAGVTQVGDINSAATAITGGLRFAAAIRYNASDFALCVNGSAPLTLASGTPPSAHNTITIGGASGGLTSWAAPISRVAMFSRAMNDAELQLLTAA
ncbi:phage head spike fiber domain-containing protein [Hydrocarboniphaga sp.]|uniref:phage head spike fiber domain-containing protein n=1 Tax=Hydrocarboniphaga sp. TaxID=2033016 RepID=UPI003D0E6DAF